MARVSDARKEALPLRFQARDHAPALFFVILAVGRSAESTPVDGERPPRAERGRRRQRLAVPLILTVGEAHVRVGPLLSTARALRVLRVA